MFNKSDVDVNTSIIVPCKLGFVTVYVSDQELHRTLSNIYDAVSDLVDQAQNLADAFGFNLEDAISKGGLMTIKDTKHEPAPKSTNTLANKMRTQEIPQKRQNVSGIHHENDENFSMASDIVDDSESREENKEAILTESVGEMDFIPDERRKIIKKVVSPTGRQFEIPERVVDETGETIVMIDTKAEAAFNANWEKQKNNKYSDQSFKDQYAVQFRSCKLCVDNKTKAPTGRVNGKPCPKCGGAGEIIIKN